MALAGVQLADLVATRVMPQFGDAHLDHLGVPDWLRPVLPVIKAAAVVALVATAKRPTPRSVVAAALVGYYAAAAAFHALSEDSPVSVAPAAACGVLAAAII